MHGSPTSLPKDSIYYPVNEEFVRDRIENFQSKHLGRPCAFLSTDLYIDGAIPAADFAKTVANEALKSHPRAWVLTAKNAWTVWFISNFLGRRGFVSILSYKICHSSGEPHTFYRMAF